MAWTDLKLFAKCGKVLNSTRDWCVLVNVLGFTSVSLKVMYVHIFFLSWFTTILILDWIINTEWWLVFIYLLWTNIHFDFVVLTLWPFQHLIRWVTSYVITLNQFSLWCFVQFDRRVELQLQVASCIWVLIDLFAHCVLVCYLSSWVQLLLISVHVAELILRQILVNKNVLVVALVYVYSITQAVLIVEFIYLLYHMLGVLLISWLMIRLA